MKIGGFVINRKAALRLGVMTMNGFPICRSEVRMTIIYVDFLIAFPFHILRELHAFHSASDNQP